jgi:hypothetical protein
MKQTTTWPRSTAAPAAVAKSRPRGNWRAATLSLLAGLISVAAWPAAAQAHGPVAPAASSYLARVSQAPAGLDAKVVDGDLRMWLSVPAGDTVVILDYRGAPYLRFSPSGVEVNENSSMYYLNQTPVPVTPPTSLTAFTPPHWHRVSGGHHYGWHDGRLHALAAVALAPGTTYVGRWSVPLRIDGHLTSIAGGIWHAGAPSIVWFWPIVVLILCVLAAWRLRRPELDQRLARALAITALTALAVAAAGRELHGRPTVAIYQLVELGAILAFIAWAARRSVSGELSYFPLFLIAIAAVWEGGELFTTLLYGYVLLPIPAFVMRLTTVLCLGTGASLLLLGFRLADYAFDKPRRKRYPPTSLSPDAPSSSLS